jgi:hypothetical protein
MGKIARENRFSVVGTTVKAAERLAQELVADEKQSRLQGDKISIATTAADSPIPWIYAKSANASAGVTSIPERIAPATWWID